MNMPLCIYHGNCADGFGAAWVVNKYFNGEVELYAGVYQEAPPDVTGRDVILVDFSYKQPIIEQMAEKANSVLILDHHKSAAEDLLPWLDSLPVAFKPTGSFDWDWSGLGSMFDMNRSGAMIAWDFFFTGEEPPQLLRHIQDRDLWRFELEGTREIQAALFSYPYDLEVWDQLMNDNDLAAIKSDGEAIERKHFKDINEFIEASAHRMEIAGYDVPALNAPYFWSSDAGHIMAKGEPFAACYWNEDGYKVFSLRSADDGVDVSEVAKLFGGGGHPNAAGFKVKRFPEALDASN